MHRHPTSPASSSLRSRLRRSRLWIKTMLTCLSIASLVAPAVAAPETVMQSAHPAIGTSTDLSHATEFLLGNFAQFSQAGTATAITVADLRIAAQNPKLRTTANFFLVSPIGLALAASDQGGADITISSLQRLERLTASDLLRDVLRVSNNRRRSASTGNYAAILRDPGVPDFVRRAVVSSLTGDQLLAIIGKPVFRGTPRDVADETTAFLGLVKLSWLGSMEAEALAHYMVPFIIDHDASDKGFSFWNKESMHISEKMVRTGAAGYVSEVLAHEGGHAIFQLSGLKSKTLEHAEAAKLTPGVVDILNEGFAGAFGNRAHIALFGSADRNIDRHLVLLNDVMDSLANDNTFYAKRYHVDTASACTQLPMIKQVLGRDLVPALEWTFGLAGDPVLTEGIVVIPSARSG